MKLKIKNELLFINLLVIMLILDVMFFPSNALRVILGIPIVLLFPGYTLIAALFPSEKGVDSIERVALSLVLSIAVVPLIGLILNYTPIGITLESTIYSLATFIFCISVFTWFRRKRLVGDQPFSLECHLALPCWRGGAWNKALSITLVLAILGSLGILSYAISVAKGGEEFTEFYVLPIEGKAADYPKSLEVGEEGKVTTVIVNHERAVVNYRVEVRIKGFTNKEVGPIILENEEEWVQDVSFVPQISGEKQELEFILYKDSEHKPYSEPLHLWLDVTEK